MTPFAPCQGCPYNDTGYCDLWETPVRNVVDCDLIDRDAEATE